MNIDVNELRPRLIAVAYRMLGTVTDAEDAVQDAFLRFLSTDDVTSPEGFLVTTTARRCIDQLRARQCREKHSVPWVSEHVDTPVQVPSHVSSESVAQAIRLMLERLSPEEGSAFLLRAVFDYEYSQIAEVLDKSETHVRQIFCRAKARLQQNESRFQPAVDEVDRLTERFLAACRAGDVKWMEHLFTDDLRFVHPIAVPFDRVAFQGIARGGPQRHEVSQRIVDASHLRSFS